MDKVREILALRRELDEYNASRRSKTTNNNINTDTVNEILRLRRNLRMDKSSSVRDHDYDEFMRLANMLHTNIASTNSMTSQGNVNLPLQQPVQQGVVPPVAVQPQFVQLGPGGPTGLQTPSASPATTTFPQNAARTAASSVASTATRSIRARQLAFAQSAGTGATSTQSSPSTSASVSAANARNAQVSGGTSVTQGAVASGSGTTRSNTVGTGPRTLLPSAMPGTPTTGSRRHAVYSGGTGQASPIVRSNTTGGIQATSVTGTNMQTPPPVRPGTPSTTTGIQRTTSNIPTTPPILKTFKQDVAANPGKLGQVVQPNMSNFSQRGKGIGFQGQPQPTKAVDRYRLLIAAAKRAVINAINRRQGKVNIVLRGTRLVHDGREWLVHEIPDNIGVDVDVDGYITGLHNASDIQYFVASVPSGSKVSIPPQPPPKFVPAISSPGKAKSNVTFKRCRNVAMADALVVNSVIIHEKDIVKGVVNYHRGNIALFSDAAGVINEDMVELNGVVVLGMAAKTMVMEVVSLAFTV